MYTPILDTKTAHKLEHILGSYESWMEILRKKLKQDRLRSPAAGPIPGTVDAKQLSRLLELQLPASTRQLLRWSAVVDATCRALAQREEQGIGAADCLGLLQTYYGLGLSPQAQEEWVSQSHGKRRKHTMEAYCLEQGAFYDRRRKILSALYMAAAQAGLVRLVQ